jgi:hypothetical protein
VSSLLQTTQGDLDITTNPGRLTLSDDKATCAAQKLRNRLLFFKNEWFLDTRLGVPWFQSILVKAPDLPLIEQILRQVILSVPSITGIVSFIMAYVPRARSIAYSFEAQCETGQTIQGGSGLPFIVKGGN